MKTGPGGTTRHAMDPRALQATLSLPAHPDLVIAAMFVFALAQFIFFTAITLDQPIIDLWGFRPAQTAASIPYMLRDGAWFAPVVPVFGEPWVFVIEFPLYQWCVSLLVWLTGLPIDACGRLLGAFFAVASLWPIALIAKSAGFGRRIILLVGALWLMAPVVVFWGRSFLIETTTVFLGLAWLAFYIRVFATPNHVDYGACLLFGILAALVKVTAFAGFLVVGFIYTCVFVWSWRRHFVASVRPVLLAGSSVMIAAIALTIWIKHADGLMTENPLTTHLRAQGLTGWYLGAWSDRLGMRLWENTVRMRALPEALGAAWFAVLYAWIRVGWRNRLFWMVWLLVIAYLSVFLLFPTLHMRHYYYQVENAVLICAAAALAIEALLQRRRLVEAYAILALLTTGQLWSLYSSMYFATLTDDLHNHPFFETGTVLREVTPPDSVIVGFGMGYRAELPYYSGRRGIILANWSSISDVRRVLFDERSRWFGGRKLGAVVDCSVYPGEAIAPALVPVRDELKRELSGKAIHVAGSFRGSPARQPSCDIFLPRE